MSIDLSRPGSDPLRPHQDLRIPSRIPSQYLSQVLPSSSSTPPVAVQIASLHRASEVARFEWRAAQRARQANRSNYIAAPLTTTNANTSPRFETTVSRTPYSPRVNSTSTSLQDAQARDARVSSRVYASQSEAYHSAVRDLSRHTSADLLDVSDGEGEGNDDLERTSETSGDSTNTDNELIAYPMAATRRMRSVEVGDHRRSTSMGHTSNEDPTIAESQVWDRMVNDLAIGAGISGVSHETGYSLASDSGPFAHQRGVPGGIAASMLALSAAIPRPESQWASSGSHGSSSSTPHRQLPHPIWARRYPGAAGEWLRGELARRASASTTQPVSSQSSTSIPRPAAHAPRWRNAVAPQLGDNTALAPSTQTSSGTDNSIYDLFSDRNRSSGARRTSNWDWNVLRFPSLDPASRERRSRLDQAPSANVQSTDATTTSVTLPLSNSSSTLAVPADTRASLPTPPPPAAEVSTPTSISRQREDVPINSEILPVSGEEAEQDSPAAVNADAANLVARMASASRQMAAARSALSQTAPAVSTSATSMTPAEGSSSTSRATRATRATQGGLSYIRHLRELDGLTERQSPASGLSDGDIESVSPPRPYEVFPWYQPPIVELDSQSHSSQDDFDDGTIDDPDGTHLHWYQMARERMAAQSGISVQDINDDPDGERIDEDREPGRHTLGVRRRVITGTSGGASQRARNRSALVMAEDNNTSVHRDVRSDSWNAVDGWTLVDQRPMSPVRRSRDEGSENVTTWLREPASPVGRFSTSPQQMNASSSPSNQRPITTSRTIHSYRPVPASDDPRTTRRPRRMASLIDSEIAPYSESRLAREDTPSPELLPTELVSSSSNFNNSNAILGRARQLTSIGRRLEEEFRSRQGELRQREERLRSEVARRRVELDQVRRRQGRIGRVIDRTRQQTSDGIETALPPSDGNEINEEILPLLGEQESSLIRRRALREPRRATLESPSVDAVDPAASTYRGAPPTPLQEILARISLNSSRMHSGMERSLRRTSSWSATTSDNLHEALQLTSLDDNHVIR
jgi:hypothetical protein